ncbi:MAG: hypothetical protein GF364_20575 [Candidatus Lokiarchaeota archaeon]|nr:hypothetical protein [Candidatus Lokiarchaeota archaeon]
MVSNTIETVVPKYAFVLQNGTILKSTIKEDSLLKVTQIISNICEKMKIKTYIHTKKLYIYRITEHFLIFLLTDLEPSEIEPLLLNLFEKYNLKINRAYSELPKSFGSIIKSVIFSMSRAAGPQPVTWYPPDFDESEAFKISMKAMLNLANEVDGASKEMLAFQPFIQYDALGIVYLFQIPFENARGNAYDSCITILADYNERAIIYEKNQELERILAKTSQMLRTKFLENVDETGENIDSDLLQPTVSKFVDSLENLSLVISKSDKIMFEMMDSINKLKHV